MARVSIGSDYRWERGKGQAWVGIAWVAVLRWLALAWVPRLAIALSFVVSDWGEDGVCARTRCRIERPWPMTRDHR